MRSRATALVCVLTFSIALLGAVGAAVAQTYQGTIRGIVKDEQGVIPAADVTLVNEATSATRSITTNEVGEYVFTSVLPGTYTLRAALPGFRTEERKGLKVATQQQVVADFTLAIAVQMNKAMNVRIGSPGDQGMIGTPSGVYSSTGRFLLRRRCLSARPGQMPRPSPTLSKNMA